MVTKYGVVFGVFLFGTLTSAALAATPKSQFLEKFKKSAPNTFCGENTYFQKCFQIDKAACAKTVNDKIGDCILSSEKEYPESLTKKEEGGNLGRKVGTCLGEKLETEWKEKKVASTECADPKKWN